MCGSDIINTAAARADHGTAKPFDRPDAGLSGEYDNPSGSEGP